MNTTNNDEEERRRRDPLPPQRRQRNPEQRPQEEASAPAPDLELVQVLRDGNCLYSSIAVASNGAALSERAETAAAVVAIAAAAAAAGDAGYHGDDEYMNNVVAGGGGGAGKGRGGLPLHGGTSPRTAAGARQLRAAVATVIRKSLPKSALRISIADALRAAVATDASAKAMNAAATAAAATFTDVNNDTNAITVDTTTAALCRALCAVDRREGGAGDACAVDPESVAALEAYTKWWGAACCKSCLLFKQGWIQHRDRIKSLGFGVRDLVFWVYDFIFLGLRV
jgi:hypothetical protein